MWISAHFILCISRCSLNRYWKCLWVNKVQVDKNLMSLVELRKSQAVYPQGSFGSSLFQFCSKLAATLHTWLLPLDLCTSSSPDLWMARLNLVFQHSPHSSSDSQKTHRAALFLICLSTRRQTLVKGGVAPLPFETAWLGHRMTAFIQRRIKPMGKDVSRDGVFPRKFGTMS